MLKLLSLFFAFTLLVANEKSPILIDECIFDDPPFASCHASTLTETESGEILCAYFAGTWEGESDVNIYLSTLSAQKWSAPKEVLTDKYPMWNPVLMTMPSGEIFLFYKAGPTPLCWSGALVKSSDGGKTFSTPLEFPAGIIGPVKNRPLLLESGELLCGSSIESYRRWGCFIDITEDGGESWEKSAPINVKNNLFGIIQPTLFHTHDGGIRMLARSLKGGAIVTAQSHDNGRNWHDIKETDLPNPNSAVDAINLTDGRILLVYNHSKTERYPLNLALSSDGGETFTPSLTLESRPGSYSYPCVIQTRDGTIHISYTWNRERIKHIALDPKWL